MEIVSRKRQVLNALIECRKLNEPHVGCCSAERLDDLVGLDHAVEVGHVEVLDVAQAWWAVRLIAEHAEETLIVAGDNGRASDALDGLVARVGADHTLACLELVACFESFDALRSHAQAEAFLGSAKSHEVLGEEFKHLTLMASQSSHVLGLKAFVAREFSALELLSTQLTLDHDLGAFALNVLEKLRASHMLILLLVTDVAAKLRALNHGVLLELEQRLPDDLALLAVNVASMRELTEVDAVAQDFVDLDDEVAALLAVRAANVITGSQTDVGLRVLRSIGGLASRTITRRRIRIDELAILPVSAGQLELAVLAEQLVALSALLGRVRELLAHDACDLLDHLTLQLVLNLVDLDVELQPHRAFLLS